MAGRAEGARSGVYPRARTFGRAAATATRQFAWVLTRESLLRLALSLVLATALWLYISSKENPVYIDYGQPIHVSSTNVTNGYTVTNDLPSVRIRIHVDNSNTFVTQSNFHAFVNLFGVAPGPHPRLPVRVLADPGIHVVNISPAYVPVMIERVITKVVPLLGNVLSPAPTGYSADAPQIEPRVIRVTGPKSLVSPVAKAYVQLNLQGAKSDVVDSFSPVLVDGQGVAVASSSRVVIDPPVVQVRVPIRPLASYRTLPILVPVRGQPAQGFGIVSIATTPAAITAKGSPRLLGHISSVSTQPVWVSHHRAGTLRARVRVTLPIGVTGDARSVIVVIQFKPVDVSSTLEVGVNPVNVAPGLVGHVRPAYVLATLVGPSSRISRVAGGVTATVNTGGYGEGVFYLTPTLTAPPGFRVISFYPQQVQVRLVPAPVK